MSSCNVNTHNLANTRVCLCVCVVVCAWFIYIYIQIDTYVHTCICEHVTLGLPLLKGRWPSDSSSGSRNPTSTTCAWPCTRHCVITIGRISELHAECVHVLELCAGGRGVEERRVVVRTGVTFKPRVQYISLMPSGPTTVVSWSAQRADRLQHAILDPCPRHLDSHFSFVRSHTFYFKGTELCVTPVAGSIFRHFALS